MAHRLEIGLRPGLRDPRGEAIERTVREFLRIPVARVRTRDVFRIDTELAPREIEAVLRELADPVAQLAALDRLETDAFDVAISVAFKPGVTDPVGKSAKVAVEDTIGRRLGADDAVYTSTLYLLEGVSTDQAERIARELLANPVIQTIDVRSRSDWLASPPDRTVPKVASHESPAVRAVDLSGSDEELVALSRDRLLALTLREMRVIRDHFGEAGNDPRRRELGLGSAPTDVELEALAQTWSEHCKHKIFNATIRYEEEGRPAETIRSLFKTFIRGATERIDRAVRDREGKSWLVSVFHDNAGVVEFDATSHLVFKVETHNSPSALDPYGGAITGIVGVNRDPFGTGLGSELLSNVWGYCFASPFRDEPMPKGLLHPRRVRDGVHRGVIDGGNQSGIPYGRGWELFDERFLGKPLVFCGTVGALPVQVAGRAGHEKGARPGDRVVMVGGRIGADGIHGATFSSAALDESAPIQAVQIGDPITQKRMFDFLLEARDLGLYSAITDNGAGGLSSSVGEMAEVPGGARIDLAKAPLKYRGLAPWEILLSEAQERMTLAVPRHSVDALLALAARREVEATVLGEFTDSGYFHVTHDEKTIAHLEMRFLHEGDPDLDLTARWQPAKHAEPPREGRPSVDEALVGMAGWLNLCSNEVTARHYDHEVKGLTVVKPWVGVGGDVPSEATVFLVRHGSNAGYVLSEGVNPFYSDIDTHAMAQSALDEAVRRQLCAGARLDRIAVLDNFCWPDPVQSEATPDGEHKLAQLVRACRGLHDLAVAYGTPLISGKDSMKNDSVMGGVKISVPPTLLVSAIGRIEDVRRAVTLEPMRAGDLVLLVGETRDETGGSQYFQWLGHRQGARTPIGEPRPWVGNAVPRVRPEETLPIYRALDAALRDRLLQSATTPAKGGLAFALVRTALAGGLGLDVDLDRSPSLRALPADVAIFSESNGRFVLTVDPSREAAVAALFPAGTCVRVGVVTEAPRLRVSHGGTALIDRPLAELRAAWKETLAHV